MLKTFRINRCLQYALPIFAFLIAIALVSLQPSDLYQYSQPATVAYTVDILENGRWLLPQDTLGYATKPPLYNWLSAPMVWVFGESVFVFKLMSIFAGLSVLLMILFSARFFVTAEELERHANVKSINNSDWIALLSISAGLIWVATPLAIKISYYARPDMLLCAFLTAGWLLSTHLIRNPSCKHGGIKKILLWLCVAGAGLSKGPAAILVIAYIYVYSKWLPNSASCAKSTGWHWGVIFSLGIILGWLAGAYIESPKHVKTQLIGYEFVNRITGTNFVFAPPPIQNAEFDGTTNVMDINWYQERYYKPKHERDWKELYLKPWGVLKTFVGQFLPWSILLIGWLFIVPSGKRRSHPSSAAVVWVPLVLLLFCLPTVLRPRYLLPAFPAAAILASYILCNVVRFRPMPSINATAMMLILLTYTLIIGRGFQGLWEQNALSSGSGKNEVKFSRNVQAIVGMDKIVFDHFVGDNNVQALLGYSQPDSPTSRQYEQAQWLIKPVTASGVLGVASTGTVVDSTPVLVSKPIDAVTNETMTNKNHRLGKSQPVELGLYSLTSIRK